MSKEQTGGDRILSLMKRHGIQLSPVLGKSTRGKTRILFWHAGKRSMSTNGWTNIVLNDDTTMADTPEEAVLTLVEKLNQRKRAAGKRKK
jgi:hypothetical protein